jgi:hypothetical protein
VARVVEGLSPVEEGGTDVAGMFCVTLCETMVEVVDGEGDGVDPGGEIVAVVVTPGSCGPASAKVREHFVTS